MSGVTTCPLCGSQRWKSDNHFVINQQDLEGFRFKGYSLRDISKALIYATAYGWKPPQ